MNLQLLLLQQTTIMFLLIGVGYTLTKVKMLTPAGSKELSSILLYIALPSVVLDSFISAGREGMRDLSMSFLLAAIGMIVSMGIAFAIYGTRKGIDNFAASFGNAGFMGLPLVIATFGADAVVYVTGTVALLNILQWTYGVLVMTKSTDAIKLKKLVKNPIIVSVAIGLVLVYLPFDMPDVITQPIGFCKNMNTPLAMIIVGISLARTNLLESVKRLDMYFLALVRLVLIPLATMVVFMLLPIDNREMLLAMMVVLSAPVGSNLAIVAQMYDGDVEKSIQSVCFTTLLSIVTIPVVMGIVERFI